MQSQGHTNVDYGGPRRLRSHGRVGPRRPIWLVAGSVLATTLAPRARCSQVMVVRRPPFASAVHQGRIVAGLRRTVQARRSVPSLRALVRAKFGPEPACR